jgi:hypothetical protein
MRANGAVLAIAAVAALTLASRVSPRGGPNVVRSHRSPSPPLFQDVAELVYHGYSLSSIRSVFPDHSSFLLGNRRLLVKTDRGDAIVSINQQGDPEMRWRPYETR